MQITQVLFALVIVAGVVGGMALNNYLKILRENQGQIRSLEKQFGSRLARLEAMEERITVLERIVTDRRYDLDRQFSDLEKTG